MDPFSSSAHGLPARPRRTDGGEPAAGQDSTIISAMAGCGQPIQDIKSHIGPGAEQEQL
jgi:hypothetical protein